MLAQFSMSLSYMQRDVTGRLPPRLMARYTCTPHIPPYSVSPSKHSFMPEKQKQDQYDFYADSKKKVYMRKVEDFCENTYPNPDIFGTK